MFSHKCASANARARVGLGFSALGDPSYSILESVLFADRAHGISTERSDVAPDLNVTAIFASYKTILSRQVRRVGLSIKSGFWPRFLCRLANIMFSSSAAGTPFTV